MSNPTPQPRPAPSSAPRPAAAPAPKPSKLAGIVPAALPNARRFFFYGPRKIGKSTVAADAPAPIFIDTTNSTEHLHVGRYPMPDGGWTWGGLLDAIDDLRDNPHEFKTLVIEDIGDVEHNVVWKHVLVTHKTDHKEPYFPTTIEGYGFGKGYKIAAQYWRILSARLDELRMRRKMHVIVLGHSQVKNFKNPMGEDYDTWQPTIDPLAAGIIGADFDVLCFMSYADSTVNKGSGFNQKARGATGDRVYHLEYNAAWPMVGGRMPMSGPIDIPIEHPFQPFMNAMAQASMTPAMLRQKIDAELARLGTVFVKADGLEAKADSVKGAVDRAGDNFDTLSRYLTVLRQAQPKTETKETTP